MYKVVGGKRALQTKTFGPSYFSVFRQLGNNKNITVPIFKFGVFQIEIILEILD